MHALTIQNPYAWAVIHGGKTTENRRSLHPFSTHVGERIAIHAGKTWSDQGARDELIVDLIGRRPVAHDITFADMFGVIIGTAIIDTVHIADSCCDPWGWEQPKHTASVDPVVHVGLVGARATPWVRCTGQLGLWTVPADVERQLEVVRR